MHVLLLLPFSNMIKTGLLAFSAKASYVKQPSGTASIGPISVGNSFSSSFTMLENSFEMSSK